MTVLQWGGVASFMCTCGSYKLMSTLICSFPGWRQRSQRADWTYSRESFCKLPPLHTCEGECCGSTASRVQNRGVDGCQCHILLWPALPSTQHCTCTESDVSDLRMSCCSLQLKQLCRLFLLPAMPVRIISNSVSFSCVHRRPSFWRQVP